VNFRSGGNAVFDVDRGEASNNVRDFYETREC
jgi:hypothetical protein